MSTIERPETSTSEPSLQYLDPPATPPRSGKRSVDSKNPDKYLKARHRRVKANTRERNRMHGLNDALERLRHHIPLSYHHQRLSKIETLRLARNYIAVLTKSLNGEVTPSNTDFARVLAQGMSQTTSNLIASTFQVHPRLLIGPDRLDNNQRFANVNQQICMQPVPNAYTAEAEYLPTPPPPAVPETLAPIGQDAGTLPVIHFDPNEDFPSLPIEPQPYPQVAQPHYVYDSDAYYVGH